MTLQELLIEIHGDYSPQGHDRSNDRRKFRVDDQNGDDVSEYFCTISISLTEPESDRFRLTLYRVPWDDDVEVLAARLRGEWDDVPTGRVLRIPMTIRSVPDIRMLARAIRKVTGRGKRYVDSNRKWSTRRTADSLDRFARLLSEWNRNGRKMTVEEMPY